MESYKFDDETLKGAYNNSCRIQRREIFSKDLASEGVVAGSYGD